MNTFFKWTAFAIMVMAVPFTAILAYDQNWISAVTWVILGFSGWINYKNMVSLIENEKVVNARIEEMINDYRS